MADKEIDAILISILFLVLGVVLLWFITTVLGIHGDSVLITMLLLPTISFLILSGKLKQFRTPGGFEAIFDTPIETALDISEAIELIVEETEGIEKGDRWDLDDQIAGADLSKSVFLSLKLGTTLFGSQSIQQFIEQLSIVPYFKLVVFLDQNGKYLGFIPHWKLTGILYGMNSNNEFLYNRSKLFLSAINNPNQRNEISRFPEVIDELFYPDFTYKQILVKMRDLNLDSLVVINKDRTVKGIIERDRLMNEMILKSQR